METDGSPRRQATTHPLVLVTAAVQHVIGLASFAIFPVLVADAAGLKGDQLAATIQNAFLALAAANVIQAIRLGPIGTGHLIPTGYTAAYFASSLLAAQAGGLPLVAGMTMFAGALEILLARAIPRLRGAFGPELVGVVLMLVGMANGLAGIRQIVNSQPAGITSAGASLAAMIVFGSVPQLATPAILIGISAGYGVGAWLHIIDVGGMQEIPLLAFPSIPTEVPIFSADMMLPFVIVALVASIKQAAFVEQAVLNDGHLLDERKIVGGVTADGLGTVVSAALGSLGMNASASSAGIKVVTGVHDRIVGIFISVLLAMLALLPHVAAVVARVPKGVAASVLVYTAVFVIVSGLKSFRGELDRNRSLIVGGGLLGGLAIEAAPQLNEMLPKLLAPLFSSSLGAGSTVAIVFCILARISPQKK